MEELARHDELARTSDAADAVTWRTAGRFEAGGCPRIESKVGA